MRPFFFFFLGLPCKGLAGGGALVTGALGSIMGDGDGDGAVDGVRDEGGFRGEFGLLVVGGTGA
jgi:hypothetical protein